MKMVLRSVLCALLALLLAGVNLAMAEEEELYTAHVELYSEGAFPSESVALVSTFGLNSFDEYMLEQLNAQAEEIDVSSYQMEPEDFYAAYQRLLNANPEMFFVSGGYRYYSNSSCVTRILPDYKYTGAELTYMKGVFNSGVNAVVSYARRAGTDVGRLLRANDYMCANYEYDLSYTISSPELFFENGTGVCQAYMLAYRAVLNKLGFTNIMVSSSEINHTWNMVYLDGSWYHIDVTWNDPIADKPLRACHSNFLLSDAGITATGHYGWDDGWEAVTSAGNTKYDNFFWKKINQVVPMQGDVIYYTDSDYSTINRDVYSYDLTSGQTSKIHTYSYGYGSYYKDYNPVWVEDGTIYYAVRDSLYGVPMAGGNASLLYSTGSSDLWIWYPFRSGSALKVYVASSPTGSGSIYSCALNLSCSLTMDQTAVRLNEGETVQLNAVLTPDSTDAYTLEWSSADETIAIVDASGLVSAVGAGVVEITAKYNENTTAVCTVVVNAAETVSLPADTVKVMDEAFANTAAAAIELPEGITTIGARAFADSDGLLMVNLPSSLISIAEDAFSGSTNVTLLCIAGSAGEAYAAAQGIPYVILP